MKCPFPFFMVELRRVGVQSKSSRRRTWLGELDSRPSGMSHDTIVSLILSTLKVLFNTFNVGFKGSSFKSQILQPVPIINNSILWLASAKSSLPQKNKKQIKNKKQKTKTKTREASKVPCTGCFHMTLTKSAGGMINGLLPQLLCNSWYLSWSLIGSCIKSHAPQTYCRVIAPWRTLLPWLVHILNPLWKYPVHSMFDLQQTSHMI